MHHDSTDITASPASATPRAQVARTFAGAGVLITGASRGLGAALARELEVNVVGPFRLTKAVAGAMALRGRGLIVHISSDAAVSAYPRWGAYGVSKAALDHLGRSWAAELEGTGVRVITIDPGEMNTRMHAKAIPDADPATLADPADVAARIVRLLGRADSLPNGARVEVAAAEGAS